MQLTFTYSQSWVTIKLIIYLSLKCNTNFMQWLFLKEKNIIFHWKWDSLHHLFIMYTTIYYKTNNFSVELTAISGHIKLMICFYWTSKTTQSDLEPFDIFFSLSAERSRTTVSQLDHETQSSTVSSSDWTTRGNNADGTCFLLAAHDWTLYDKAVW